MAHLTEREQRALRKRIAKHAFLLILDDESNVRGFAVHDRRGGLNLGTWIDSAEFLDYLVEHGAEAWLVSPHNGIPTT